MVQITPKDEQLIALLRVDAREPVASLARKLGLSRTTVQDRLRRLEGSGIIAGYSLKLAREIDAGGMRAFVTLSVEPRRQVEVARTLAKFHQIETLHTVSGKYDLVAQVKTGWASVLYDGNEETELKIKEATSATPRCIPSDFPAEEGPCFVTGAPSAFGKRVIFGRSY